MNTEDKVCIILGCIALSNLDTETQAELINFIWELKEKAGIRE